MNNSQYWRLREAKIRERLIDQSIYKSEKELKKVYRELAKDVITLMENSVLKMQEGKSISHNFNYQRYYELLEQIQGKLRRLGEKEYQIIKKDMTDLYKSTSQSVDKVNQFKSPPLNESRIKQVINSEWVGDGKNWSDRIWNHQGELSQKLTKGLLNIMESGVSPEILKKELMKDFNVNYSQASRIVRTEYIHIANKASVDRYKSAGITKYQWLCNEDERTCPYCSSMDGKIFDIDSGILPPNNSHPFVGVLRFLCWITRRPQ